MMSRRESAEERANARGHEADGEAPGLAPPEPAVPPDLSDLLGGVQAQIAAERGPRAWLRSRATPVRLWLAFALPVLFAVGTVLGFMRPDIAVYPASRMLVALSGMVGLFALEVRAALRPLHRPARPAWASAATLAAAVLGLLALYLLPFMHVQPGAPQAQDLPALLAGARPCLVLGLVVGSGVFLALGALDRGGARRAPLRAAAGGLCANLVLQLHCPNSATPHVLLGHYAALVLLAGAALVWAGIREARD